MDQWQKIVTVKLKKFALNLNFHLRSSRISKKICQLSKHGLQTNSKTQNQIVKSSILRFNLSYSWSVLEIIKVVNCDRKVECQSLKNEINIFKRIVRTKYTYFLCFLLMMWRHYCRLFNTFFDHLLLYVHVLFWFTLMIFNAFNQTHTHTLTHTLSHSHTLKHTRYNVSNYIFWLKILRWRKNPKICSRLSQLISKMFTHRKGVHWHRIVAAKNTFSLSQKSAVQCC